MFTIAIVEDDPKARETLMHYITQFQQETGFACAATCFCNGLDFLEFQDYAFDLVLMDIEMPHMNGMEAARKLRERDNHASLIFVTNMSKYALKGYEVDALDFLVKPVGYFNFSLKLRKAIQVSEKKSKEGKSILIKTNDGMERVFIDDIYYVDVDGHNLTYHTDHQDYTERSTMKKCEEELPNWQFARCNHCYLVNMQFVRKVTDKSVFLQDGDKLMELAMSQSKKKEFMNQFAQFVRRT